jgi:hypothetical protein
MIRLLIVVTMLAACTPARRSDAPAPPVDPTRLRHEQHAQVACASCHRPSASAPSEITRPGADDHRPCDDGACHKREFLGPPGVFCETCHKPITIEPLTAELKPYPIEDAWQSLPPAFSHRRHLDANLMENRVGFHVACGDCHLRDGQLARPDHATCARCHASEAGLAEAPRMADCARCHAAGTRPRTRARLITGDLKFDHARHRTDRKGGAIRCEDCHGRSARSNDHADHAPPRIESCVSCHDDGDRVPYQLRMRMCETCHRDKQAALTVLAPRSHLPATERPLDHTLAFRRDHAEVAAREAARCATCHTQMSGNPRQACDECHQRMLPADHRITFRELDHGPEAVADRTRCATCHVVEFCTACHSQRPRSHGMVSTFTYEHGRLARLNVRSCITCHGDRFCLQCHTGLAEGSRR